MKARPTSLPHIVYYNDDHSCSPTCTEEISKKIGVTYSLPSTWSELTREIECGRFKIVFHIDMIRKSNFSVANFISSIKTLSKFMAIHKPLRIMVLITPATPKHKIQELQEAGVLCLGLDLNYYSLEEVAKCTDAVINGRSYWPDHIIDALPDAEKKPIHVVFRQNCQEVMTSERIAVIENIGKKGLTLRCASTWDELGEVLRENPYQISAHTDMITDKRVTMHEFISMLETMIKVICERPIPIAIIIEKNTPLRIVKELQKTSVFGIIPSVTSFDISEVINGLEALSNRVPHWPKNILEILPGNPRKQADKHNFELTTRQQEVYNLISTRGLSNKQIARSLSISESTVKLHITEIFKKYGVRNRTQLAVFSHS